MKKMLAFALLAFSLNAFANTVVLQPSQIGVRAIDGWFANNFLVIQIPGQEIRIHYPDFSKAELFKDKIDWILRDAQTKQKGVRVDVTLLYLIPGDGIDLGVGSNGLVLSPSVSKATPDEAFVIDGE